MKHKPFDTWILLPEILLPDQVQALDEHLKNCQHCRQIKQALMSAETLFQTTFDAQPAPGFSQRWQARLEEDRQEEMSRRHRWHSWMALIVMGNTVAFWTVMLSQQLLATFSSPAEFFLMWVFRFTSLFSSLTVAGHILSTLIDTLPRLIPPAGWAAILSLFGVGGLLIMVSMTKLSQLSRRT
jgi:hypothetical protein